MADISQYLQAIMNAVYGEDVRGSIHDAIEIINDVSEVVLSTGTAVDSASSSSTGFYTDSLYLNTNTFELWKCIGTDSWQSQGTLKGENGNGIASIEKTGTSGLIDTYTITYDNGDTDTFTVTNGEDGNKWYRGTGISGKAVNPTVYSGSGVTKANVNDFYLNPSEGAIYYCVTGGDASTATWSYDFTLTGGGGGTSDYGDLQNKPQINSNTLSGNQTGSQLGLMNTGSVSWSQIQTSTGATKIAEVTIEGTKQDVYAPTGGGGATTFAALSDTDINNPQADQIVQYKSVSGSLKLQNVNMPQGGHTMTPTPNASLSESDIVTAVNAGLTEGGINDDVLSAFGVGKWSNTMTKTYIVQGIAGSSTPIGTSGIGTWDDTGVDQTGWVTVPALVGASSNGNIDVNLLFDPSTVSVPIVLGGYIIDDTTGKMCIKFGNEIPDADTHTAKVGIEVTIKRTETTSVS